MLRYAVLNAPSGATITFDPALNGQTITLDGSSPNNHIKITRDVTIQGPGAGLLTITGSGKTRILFIAGGTVTIAGVKLANGFAKGGDGAGGGGGAAGMGGAVFLNSGNVTLTGVTFSGNQAQGGLGAGGIAGGGGGFGGNGMNGFAEGGGAGGPGGDLTGGGGGAGGYNLGAFGGTPGSGGGFSGGGGGSGTLLGLQIPGGQGGFGGGGGGGMPGASGGFAGGTGGAAGGGGAGLGGAIFAGAGGLQLVNTTFSGNSTAGGAAGGAGATNGEAKAGSIFICSSSFCGAGHDASVILMGATVFQGNTAGDAGATPACPGRDDFDVCGNFTSPSPTHFALSAPPAVTSSIAFNLSIKALDANNNIVVVYSGTVHFGSSDPMATLPPDTTLSNGQATFPVTLRNLGSQTIAAADTGNSALAGTAGPIAVAAATPTHFSVSAPDMAVPGVPFNFTVTALDANNNVTVAYTGAVRFTSSDPNAALPAGSTLSQGVGSFTATLFSGPTRTITATDSTNASIAGTSNPIGASLSGISLAAAGASPSAGSGSQTTFTFFFTDPHGWEDLSVVNVLINHSLDGRDACYLAYVVPSQTLFLVDDEGDPGGPFAGSVTLGNSSAIQNLQCAVTLLSATGSGELLSVTVNITFKVGFGGNQIAYLAARDTAQDSSGWQALGVWQAPLTPPGTISVTGIAPARGAQAGGTAGTFTLTLNDSKGASDIGIVNLLVNNFIDGRQACYLAYAASSNTLLLVDDQGDAGGPFAGSMVLNGGGGTIQNSQCSVSRRGSSAVLSGNTLTLTLNITFKAAFMGNRILYAAGRDNSGGNNTDWQALGTWTVQ